MKYLCLGYHDERKWEALSAQERDALIEECFAYDQALRDNGHFIRGEALQSAWSATTLRYGDGKVIVTDGPYAEAREQLGGLLYLEANDLDQAIQLISNHPGVRIGPFEIRPIDEELTDRANP